MRYPAILAAAAAVLGAATALAAPAAAETVSVKYHDLDLSTPAGQAQLERRVDNAARAVCGMDEVTVGTRIASSEARQCYTEIKSRMHEQVAQAIARDSRRG